MSLRSNRVLLMPVKLIPGPFCFAASGVQMETSNTSRLVAHATMRARGIATTASRDYSSVVLRK